MYIPIDRETNLNLPYRKGLPNKKPLLCVASTHGAHPDRNFVATITDDTIYVWLSQPQLLLCTLVLSDNDIREKGSLQRIFWRYDASFLAATTTLHHVLIFQVVVSDESCYQLADPSESQLKRASQELFLRGPRPSVSLVPSVVMNLAAAATCCVPLREMLLVCVSNGFCHHIAWDGTMQPDYSIRMASIPFAHDQLQSKPEFLATNAACIVDAVFAPLTGGYCVVLSDGRAALLTSSDSRFHPNSILGVWVQNMRDATSCDVNHRFRLLIFGCRNGDVAAYHVDDVSGSLVQAFRVPLSVRNGPETNGRLGACLKVRTLANGTAFAAVWDTRQALATSANSDGHYLSRCSAIFTPFGAQLWCSLEGTSLSSNSSSHISVEWDTEGYRLWFANSDGLSFINVARLASSCNPVMEHHNRVVLITNNSVLISPPREREHSASAPHCVWITVPLPNEYMNANWPIKFSCLDIEEGKHLVVAGTHGIAHCSVNSGRWRIFGNESQERDLIVTGGVFLWNGVVGAACTDGDSGKELLRFYPTSTKLDNRFCSVADLDARVLMLSTRDDALVTFDVESKILIYRLRRTDKGDPESHAKIQVDRLAEIRISDLIPHPACLVSLQMTKLSLDSNCGVFFAGVDTVMINVSGRLLTLNPKNAARNTDDRGQLNQPITVASFVEQMWHDKSRTESKVLPNGSTAHLNNALWISCGSKGMKVWLPLLPGRHSQGNQETSFIGKRIMLPFELDIYPAVISACDCLAIGVESMPLQYSMSGGKTLFCHTSHRNSEVFVHHLLRQLLKRNLGVFALEVAASCRKLPHFPHSLELLLHGVLEEEATSSDPIPDPLLPRCVAFIQEFPEFLKTVAHCARKTELALWPALFAVTGSPNDLFEACLREGQLGTAASFLIVLQSIETSQTSQEQVVRLLREALSSGEWSIAQDMIRFARSIDAEDMESPARSPPMQRSRSRRTTSVSALPLNNAETNELVFSRFQASARVSKIRPSHEHKDGQRKDSTGSTSNKKVGRAQSNDTGPPSPVSVSNPMAEKMDQILLEHVGQLLDNYCIKDIGFICTQLCVDVRQVTSSRHVEDYALALTRLHSQFSWPYPVPGKHVVDHLEKKFGSMRLSASSASLNGFSNGELPKPSNPAKVTKERVSVATDLSLPSEGESTHVEDACLVPTGESSPVNVAMPIRPHSPAGSSTTTTAVETPDTRSTTGEWQGVDVLVGESSSRGPSNSQLQLSYLLQLFSSIADLDWVFLICVLSRDMTRLRTELNASSIEKWGVEAFGRTRLGARTLLSWASSDCLGYVPIVQMFCAHLDMVAEQAGCLNLPPEPTKNSLRPTSRTAAKSPMSAHAVEKGLRNPKLREAFRPRERSRSVDRTQASISNEEGCSIM